MTAIQLDIFGGAAPVRARSAEPRPRARKSDPGTSKAAAAAAVDLAASHRMRVLACLGAHGGQGAEQVGQRIGMEPYQVRKRLPELAALRYAEWTDDVRYTASGRPERIWRITREGRAYVAEWMRA